MGTRQPASLARPVYGVPEGAVPNDGARGPSPVVPLLILVVVLAAASVWFVALPAFAKPVRAERLYRALGRALASSAGGDQPDDETIPVTVGSTTRLVRRAEIRWVQANGDYSRLYTPTCDHLVRIPLSELAERWSGAGFVRVHRSYLVHRDAVTEVRLAGSAPTVVLAEIELPVSRRLVPSVRDALLR